MKRLNKLTPLFLRRSAFTESIKRYPEPTIKLHNLNFSRLNGSRAINKYIPCLNNKCNHNTCNDHNNSLRCLNFSKCQSDFSKINPNTPKPFYDLQLLNQMLAMSTFIGASIGFSFPNNFDAGELFVSTLAGSMCAFFVSLPIHAYFETSMIKKNHKYQYETNKAYICQCQNLPLTNNDSTFIDSSIIASASATAILADFSNDIDGTGDDSYGGGECCGGDGDGDGGGGD